MRELPRYQTLKMTRRGRLLEISMNRPELFNAVNLTLHQELAEVFVFALADPDSDLVLLTGEGKAFSAGGDINHISNNANHPELFDEEVRLAKRIIFAMLDLDKPLICKMNGHAVGLAAAYWFVPHERVFVNWRLTDCTRGQRHWFNQSLPAARRIG